MAIWLIRAGSHGEYEQKFIQEGRLYVTWDELNLDLSKLQQRGELTAEMTQRYPGGQAQGCAELGQSGLALRPRDAERRPRGAALKTQPGGSHRRDYGRLPRRDDWAEPFFHWRAVKWIGEAIPARTLARTCCFPSAFLTICRIQRNNAEQRIAAMRAHGWKAETLAAPAKAATATTDDVEAADADLRRVGTRSRSPHWFLPASRGTARTRTG